MTLPSLPPGFWEDERRRLLAILGPKITQAAQMGVQLAATKAGIGLNMELANQAAADWARAYTDDLLAYLGTTSEKLVGDALAAWIETPGSTMGDLVNNLAPKFGGNVGRADLIAVTEVTRAVANGEMLTYQSNGIERWRWNTNRDDLVCPVCLPLNGKVVEIGQPFGIFRGKTFNSPPCHPGCRCWQSPVVGNRQSQNRQFWPGVSMPGGGG